MKHAHFEVHKGRGEKKDGWFWELYDVQGFPGEHSRCYDSKADAIHAIMYLKRNTANAPIVERDEG